MALSVSVIISTHDRPAALARAVRSVLAQSYRPDGLIVISDGGGQVTPDFADAARASGVRFVSERLDRPSLTASRNRGVALSGGEVVLLMDDDCVLPPDYLERLVGLYEADDEKVVAGIGGLMVEPGPKKLTRRVWDVLSLVLGRGRWSPRRCAARYVSLAPALRRCLEPARRLFGGAISLRRGVADEFSFDEALAGYALGEDREFSFRVGRSAALFLAPALKVLHELSRTGRPGMKLRGRMYVANSLRIARRSVGGGAGTWLLVGYDFFGAIVQYSVYGILGRNRGNLDFAAGVVGELLARTRLALRNMLCGC